MVCFNRTKLWTCSLSLCRSHGESPSVRKSFNFVQMTLEDEEEEERRRKVQEEVTFSPVLIWKPGRRSLMKKHHRRSVTAPQEHGGDGGVERGGGGGRRRNTIFLKTMDLADALPPERSDDAVERKVCISITCPQLHLMMCTCQLITSS